MRLFSDFPVFLCISYPKPTHTMRLSWYLFKHIMLLILLIFLYNNIFFRFCFFIFASMTTSIIILLRHVIRQSFIYLFSLIRRCIRKMFFIYHSFIASLLIFCRNSSISITIYKILRFLNVLIFVKIFMSTFHFFLVHWDRFYLDYFLFLHQASRGWLTKRISLFTLWRREKEFFFLKTINSI